MKWLKSGTESGFIHEIILFQERKPFMKFLFSVTQGYMLRIKFALVFTVRANIIV